MEIKKALRVRDRTIIRVQDKLSMAKLVKMHSNKLNQELIAVQNDTPKDTPEWVREYVRGYIAAMRDELHHNHLEFCYTLRDGTIVSTYPDSPRRYSKLGYTPKQVHDLSDNSDGNFYWKDSNKIFF